MSAVHRFFTTRKEKFLHTPLEEATAPQKTFHVAVQGCSHGELARIYAACAAHEAETGKTIDLLLCCGDFQSIRNNADLASMAIPKKYKTVGDFPLYYAQLSEQSSHATANASTSYQHKEGSSSLQYRPAPYLTIFIGGNHENSDWLAEESYGGFLSPNIYYLGHSGVIVVDHALCIAGLSGIFKDFDYDRPYPPRPYRDQESAKRSAYHVRRIEVEKLRAFAQILREEKEGRKTVESRIPAEFVPNSPSSRSTSSFPLQVDVVLSHDWPAGITKYGNEDQLLRHKPLFAEEVARDGLGNPYTLDLLRLARPQHWFAAHLHCLFRARVPHHGSLTGDPSAVLSTSFTALDKCGENRGFVDFFDISAPFIDPVHTSSLDPDSAFPPPASGRERAEFEGRHRIRRHPLWMAVLKASHPYVDRNLCGAPIPCSPLSTPSRAQSPSYGDGFNAEGFLADWKRRAEAGDAGLNETCKTIAEALEAPTTATLLAMLGLEPAEPLQVNTTRGRVRNDETSAESLSTAVQDSKRSRTGEGRQGSLFPQVQEAAPVRGAPLGWVEDLSAS